MRRTIVVSLFVIGTLGGAGSRAQDKWYNTGHAHITEGAMRTGGLPADLATGRGVGDAALAGAAPSTTKASRTYRRDSRSAASSLPSDQSRPSFGPGTSK